MLWRLRNQHGRSKGEIGTELLDQLRVGPEYQFFVNGMRISGVDDLHFKFVAHQELLGRIDITARVGLIDETALLLIGVCLDHLAPRHNGLDQRSVAKYPKVKKLALELNLAPCRFAEERHGPQKSGCAAALCQAAVRPNIERDSVIERRLSRTVPFIIGFFAPARRVRNIAAATL